MSMVIHEHLVISRVYSSLEHPVVDSDWLIYDFRKIDFEASGYYCHYQ